MKRILSFVLVVVLLVSLAGCGGRQRYDYGHLR